TELVEGKTYYMGSDLPRVVKNSDVYLLPPFDEFLVAYRDRDASLERAHAQHVNPGANGIFSPIVVTNGQVIGTWKRGIKKGGAVITKKPFVKFTSQEERAMIKAEEAYQSFISQFRKG